jgi:hypothetical protein
MTYTELMQQSMMTAHDYMNHAKRDIDEMFNDGYAEQHPELIAAYMKTAAIDYATTAGLQKISESLENIATAIDLPRVES